MGRGESSTANSDYNETKNGGNKKELLNTYLIFLCGEARKDPEKEVI